ncbi:putative membrane protein [Burkholderia multivorans]
MKSSNLMIAALTVMAMGVPAAFAQMPDQPPARQGIVTPQGIINPSPGRDDVEMAKRPQGMDVEFVDEASLTSKSEVQAGQLAMERSSSPAVRAFARRMVDDHARTNARLRQLGMQKGMPVQAGRIVDPDVDALRRKTGHEFDVAYVALAGTEAHRKAIRLFEAEAHTGRDPDLRAFAGQLLPALREHLAQAQALEQRIGAASRTPG